MHPREECKLLAHYAANLFEAKRDSDKLDIALQALDPQIFAPNAWMRALQSLRPGKAVPVHEPTVQCWRDCRREVAEQLSSIAMQALCGANVAVPVEWTDMQLAWLAKAGKAPSKPENLRTIGLMPADTKAFLIVLRNEAAPFLSMPTAREPLRPMPCSGPRLTVMKHVSSFSGTVVITPPGFSAPTRLHWWGVSCVGWICRRPLMCFHIRRFTEHCWKLRFLKLWRVSLRRFTFSLPVRSVTGVR